MSELAAKGAGLILNLNASPFYPGKRQTRQKLIRRHIDRLHCPIVYVNTVGRRRQRQEHHPVRRREPGLRRRRTPRRDRAPVRGRPARRRPRSGRAARRRWSCRPTTPSARCTTRSSCRCATTCGRPASPAPSCGVSGGIDSALALAIAVDALGPGSRVGLQPAVEVQHGDDPLDRAAPDRRARRAATPSCRSRRSTT